MSRKGQLLDLTSRAGSLMVYGQTSLRKGVKSIVGARGKNGPVLLRVIV